MSSDPLRIVWDALAARECAPHGKHHDFRARCPAHNGRNRESLHVSIGADRRALVHCFAHDCTAEAIASALGLLLSDLYPDGHHQARRLPLRPLRRADFTGTALNIANTLYALEQLGEPWQLMLASDCPYCGAQGAWLRASAAGGVDADCPDGCDADRYVGALLGRVHELKAGR